MCTFCLFFFFCSVSLDWNQSFFYKLSTLDHNRFTSKEDFPPDMALWGSSGDNRVTSKTTWHSSCVTGLLELYTGLPPRVTVRIKRNFSLPADWLAGWIFCVVHKTRCLFGRALLLISLAAVPTHVPCSFHSPGKAPWSAARQGCQQRRVAGLARSPASIPLPCPLSICTAVQIGGNRDHLFRGGWVTPPCSHGWGCQGTWGHLTSPAKPLWAYDAAAALPFYYVRRQKGRLLRVKFTLMSWTLGMQRLPRHSLPLGCGAESQQFAWNAFGPDLWG